MYIHWYHIPANVQNTIDCPTFVVNQTLYLLIIPHGYQFQVYLYPFETPKGKHGKPYVPSYRMIIPTNKLRD